MSVSFADVVFKRNIRTYDIGAKVGTRKAIWHGLRRNGPRVDGQRALGSAMGVVRWQFDWARERGSCRIRRFRVFVDVEIILPKWRMEDVFPSQVNDYWQCVKRTVTRHENRHAEIWYETAYRIDKLIATQLRGPLPCHNLKAHVDHKIDPVFQEGRRRQTQFDKADFARRRYAQCRANPKTANRGSSPVLAYAKNVDRRHRSYASLTRPRVASSAEEKPMATRANAATRSAKVAQLLGHEGREQLEPPRKAQSRPTKRGAGWFLAPIYGAHLLWRAALWSIWRGAQNR